MSIIYLILVGLAVFVIGTVLCGAWLRRHDTRENAEKTSRIMHFLFFAGLVAPPTVALFYPGFARLDELVGLQPLPWGSFFLVLGVVLALPGLYFMAVSNRDLRTMGSGTNAFRLTRRIVEADVYRMTRNPMSLGYYLVSLALAFIFGSTLVTLGVVLGLIPAHLFFLKYFEELELTLRFGESYNEYRREVPFLIPVLRPRMNPEAISSERRKK
jgi:protein-S-isoprenylcysteine O-methyltransferase Ste14